MTDTRSFDQLVREAAVAGLHPNVVPRALQQNEETLVRAFLVKLLDDPDALARINAAEAKLSALELEFEARRVLIEAELGAEVVQQFDHPAQGYELPELET